MKIIPWIIYTLRKLGNMRSFYNVTISIEYDVTYRLLLAKIETFLFS